MYFAAEPIFERIEFKDEGFSLKVPYSNKWHIFDKKVPKYHVETAQPDKKNPYHIEFGKFMMNSTYLNREYSASIYPGWSPFDQSAINPGTCQRQIQLQAKSIIILI